MIDVSWCLPTGEGINYVVTRSFEHDTGLPGGCVLLVYEGFIFNCSIPRGLRWLLNPHNPRYLRAAAVHDLLLKMGIDRVRAGAEFHAVLKEDGVSMIERYFMWKAVSTFKFR
jgi:hypothetical protein